MDKETLKIVAPVLIAFFSFLGIVFSRGRAVPGGGTEGGSGGRSLLFTGTLVTSLLAGAGINLPKWMGKLGDAATPAPAKAEAAQAGAADADAEPAPPSARGRSQVTNRDRDQDADEPRPTRTPKPRPTATPTTTRPPVFPPGFPPPAPRDDGYTVEVKPPPRVSHGDD
jgi:hypothetical protein